MLGSDWKIKKHYIIQDSKRMGKINAIARPFKNCHSMLGSDWKINETTEMHTTLHKTASDGEI